MPESNTDKKKFANFGRSFFLLFNRTTMYNASHPYCSEAIDQFLPIAQDILKVHSPLVFIMNQDQFYVDEEPVDPRINISKMLAHFKKSEVNSISFYEGLDRNETRAFVEIFTSARKYPHIRVMQKGLDASRIRHIKINHVFFKKVTTDEEIVSREAFEKISLDMADDEQIGSKKMFMDMVLENVLMEEFKETLTIKNLTEHPTEVSKNMIDADLTTYHRSDAEDKQPGLVLMHQLQIMEEVVEKHLYGIGGGAGIGADDDEGAGTGIGTGAGEGIGAGTGGGGSGSAELSELAVAVFDMKRQLINGINLQKSLGISYPNEEKIIDKANEITDRVLIRLVKEEYKSGQISPVRLAQILKRLVPDADELKRLLPKIKEALLEEGMPLSDYLDLVQALSNELQSEELSKILQESADTVGLDGADLIQELRNNPVQAAELIFLAAEIRKGAGDETVLTDLLVEYVEKLGSKIALDTAAQDHAEGEQHLRRVMGSVESKILNSLRNMDIKENILDRLEERLNSRIDEIFESLKEKWIAAQSDRPETQQHQDLSALEIMEQGVDESEELSTILRMVRAEVQSKGLDENDFKTILEEINRQKENKLKRKAKLIVPEEILSSEGLRFFLEKEIARCSRYDLPFATLSFSIVSVRPKAKVPPGVITQKLLIEAVAQKLSAGIRGADVAAITGKNKVVALLPMTPGDEAKLALRRHLKLLNTEPFEIGGIPVAIQVAGVATNFDSEKTPDAGAFVEISSEELSEMVVRIKNIHGLA